MAGFWADLADLVLPTECAGCLGSGPALRYGVCEECVRGLETLRPVVVRPLPAPSGLPLCFALGRYDGTLREVLLSYKERGRHGLARPLGRLLAEVAAAAAGGPRPVLLIPVPASARAARERYGDHMARLARHAAARMRAAGWSVSLAHPLRALPRQDSTSLSRVERAAAAATGFRLRPGRVSALRRAASGRTVVLLDDIVTTGATLSAVTRLLEAAGVRVRAAALLAATVRRLR